MSKTVAKQDCKCYQCGATISEGQAAQWFEKVSTGHGEWSGKAYQRTQWKLICESGCGDRLYAKEQESKFIKEQQAAQLCIEQLRSFNMSQSDIDKMIAYYANKGIVVK